MPEILNITRHAGIAGQVQFDATVRYTFGADVPDDVSTCSFVGSPIYGGPVVMVMPSGVQVFVTSPDRFGGFGREWVEAFFAA